MDVDLDDDGLLDVLLEKMAESKACNEASLSNLKTLLDSIHKAADSESDLDIFFEDCEDEISEILNDALYREAELGPAATQCAELLDIVYSGIAAFNGNVEVVLATNPHRSEELTEHLMKSEYTWETYGTTQALARNTQRVDLLRRLATSSDTSTRYEVADNPNTPPDVLSELASDIDFSDSHWYNRNELASFIQIAVATNTNTDRKTLDGFVDGRYSFTSDQLEAVRGWKVLDDQDLMELQASLKRIAEERISNQSV